MKKLGTDAYNEIVRWMYRNARPLELALWQLHFEDGSRDKVIELLGFYQNGDGGFGNTLEPDSWNPESCPYTTMIAIGILRTIGFTDTGHPMIKGIFRYLESGVHSSGEGWHFGIPSNDEFPRAPWWTYDESVNAVQDMGITAALCAFVLRYGDRQQPLFDRACGYVDKILERLKDTEDFGEMGAGGLGILVRDIEESGLSSRFDVSGLKAILDDVVGRTMERDPEKWAFYTPRPSEFIQSPDSPYYKGNEEIVETEFNYLIDTRNPGGVWDITWTWFDLGEKYPKEFAISENWWKGSKAMEKVGFLKAFGRI